MKKPKVSMPEDVVLSVALQRDFFSISFVSEIYDLCVGEQFEYTTLSNFFTWVNMKEPNPQITYYQGEKTRCCYLIKRMAECIEVTQYRDAWIKWMLNYLDISESHFKSHAHEPGKDDKLDPPEVDKRLKHGINDAIEADSTIRKHKA